MDNRIQTAYIAGFLDGDGSIYVRAKPNPTYKFGFQIALYIVLFQSQKDQKNFEKICSLIGLGHLRIRKDRILEYIISRNEAIRDFLKITKPFLILKKEQADLMLEILDKKERVRNRNDFQALLNLIDRFRDLNFSKKRKKHTITP